MTHWAGDARIWDKGTWRQGDGETECMGVRARRPVRENSRIRGLISRSSCPNEETGSTGRGLIAESLGKIVGGLVVNHQIHGVDRIRGLDAFLVEGALQGGVDPVEHAPGIYI